VATYSTLWTKPAQTRLSINMYREDLQRNVSVFADRRMIRSIAQARQMEMVVRCQGLRLIRRYCAIALMMNDGTERFLRPALICNELIFLLFLKNILGHFKVKASNLTLAAKNHLPNYDILSFPSALTLFHSNLLTPCTMKPLEHVLPFF
jgi:hypothetical protein